MKSNEIRPSWFLIWGMGREKKRREEEKKKKKKKKKKRRKPTKVWIVGVCMETIYVWICMDCYGFVWILVCSISRV